MTSFIEFMKCSTMFFPGRKVLLPPLDGREMTTPAKEPDWYTEGGKSVPASKDTRISVPEPAHYHPEQAGDAIVSVPGSQRQQTKGESKIKCRSLEIIKLIKCQ